MTEKKNFKRELYGDIPRLDATDNFILLLKLGLDSKCTHRNYRMYHSKDMYSLCVLCSCVHFFVWTLNLKDFR